MKFRLLFLFLGLTSLRNFPVMAEAFPRKADFQILTSASTLFQGGRSDTETAGFQFGGSFDFTAGVLLIDAVGLHFGLYSEFFTASAFNGDRNLKGYASVGPRFLLFYRGTVEETETVFIMPGLQAGTALLLGKYHLIDNRFFYPVFDTALFCDFRLKQQQKITLRIFFPFSASFRRDMDVCLKGGIGVGLLADRLTASDSTAD